MPRYFQSSSLLYPHRKTKEKLLVAGSFLSGGNAGDSAALIALKQFLEWSELDIAVETLSSSSSGLLDFENHYYLDELNEPLLKYLYDRAKLLLVIGGGAFFGCGTVPKLEVFIKNLSLKTALFCIGTDCVYSENELNEVIPQIKKLRSHIDYFSTRSTFAQSASEIMGIQPTNSEPVGDIVYMLDSMPSFYQLKEKSTFSIGVNLRSFWTEDLRLTDWIAGLLDTLITQKGAAKVYFFPFDCRTDSDLQIHSQVVEKMQHKDKAVLINKAIYPPHLQDMISQMDLMIGMRLHACIMAYNMNVPFVTINYHPKLGSFLDHVGLKNQFLFEGEPPEMSYGQYLAPQTYPTIEEAIGKINKALKNSPSVSPQIRRKQVEDHLTQILQENFIF